MSNGGKWRREAVPTLECRHIRSLADVDAEASCRSSLPGSRHPRATSLGGLEANRATHVRFNFLRLRKARGIDSFDRAGVYRRDPLALFSDAFTSPKVF